MVVCVTNANRNIWNLPGCGNKWKLDTKGVTDCQAPLFIKNHKLRVCSACTGKSFGQNSPFDLDGLAA